MTTPAKGGVAGCLMAAALVATGGTPALAGDACTGTYMTTQMQKIPLPVTVRLAQEPENPKLATRFLDGVREGGGQIDPASPLQMTLAFTLTTAGGAQVYNNFSWADQSGAFVNVQAAAVEMTAQVMDTTSYAYVWAASASCRVQVADAGAVAYELGRLIGRTLGRDVQNGRL
jgi:hypothetical protein